MRQTLILFPIYRSEDWSSGRWINSSTVTQWVSGTGRIWTGVFAWKHKPISVLPPGATGKVLWGPVEELGVWTRGRYLWGLYWVTLHCHSPLRRCNPKNWKEWEIRGCIFPNFFPDSSDKGGDIISKKAARNGVASRSLSHVPGMVLSKGDNDKGCRHSCLGLIPQGHALAGGRHRAWRAVLSGSSHSCHQNILTEKTHVAMLPSCECRIRAEHGTGAERVESAGASVVGWMVTPKYTSVS